MSKKSPSFPDNLEDLCKVLAMVWTQVENRKMIDEWHLKEEIRNLKDKSQEVKE